MPHSEAQDRSALAAPRALLALRAHALDLALGGAGLALGWMAPWFPFGRDQGLYHYVAREWVMRGAVPYRDVFDHKTPGLYLVHALAIALFGENMWGIRLLEMLGVLLTGLVAATFTVSRGARPHPGVRGAAVLTAGMVFFGMLNYWDQSQSEIWYSLLGVCSVWAVRHVQRRARAEIAAGAFAAAALIMKPPALWFVLVALIALGLRARAEAPSPWRGVLLGLVRFGVGALLVTAPVIGYFGLEGALPDMFEIVIQTNAYYAKHEAGVPNFAALVERTLGFFWVFPQLNPLFVLGLTLATGVAFLRRDAALRERHLVAGALVLAGIAATAMQQKFYLLHWVALLSPAAILGALLAADCRDLIPALRGRALAPMLFVAAMIACWSASDSRAQWLKTHRLVQRYLDGQISRDAYADAFQFPEIGFFYGDSERAGNWLAQHAQPDDSIAVRGFEPQIYAVAHRRYPGRFFWTIYLTQESRAEPERRAKFRAEERGLFELSPPRFVVALDRAGNDLDAPDYFHERGYEDRARFGQFVILERTRAAQRGTP